MKHSFLIVLLSIALFSSNATGTASVIGGSAIRAGSGAIVGYRWEVIVNGVTFEVYGYGKQVDGRFHFDTFGNGPLTGDFTAGRNTLGTRETLKMGDELADQMIKEGAGTGFDIKTGQERAMRNRPPTTRDFSFPRNKSPGAEAARAAKEAAERAAKESAERAAKEAVERAARESAERAARKAAEEAAARAAREAAEKAAEAVAIRGASRLGRYAIPGVGIAAGVADTIDIAAACVGSMRDSANQRYKDDLERAAGGEEEGNSQWERDRRASAQAAAELFQGLPMSQSNPGHRPGDKMPIEELRDLSSDMGWNPDERFKETPVEKASNAIGNAINWGIRTGMEWGTPAGLMGKMYQWWRG